MSRSLVRSWASGVVVLGLASPAAPSVADPADAAAPGITRPAPPKPSTRLGSGLGISVRRDVPLEIEADELEASRLEDGRQQVIFSGNVKVVQDELNIACSWLEALYPSEGSGGGPERFTCRGNVRIAQRGAEALCDEAVFDRLQNRADCSGAPARLRRGDSVVEGPHIRFDTLNEKITVRGGARVRVQPDATRDREIAE